MKPAAFDYHAPTTLGDAVALLDRFDRAGEDAKIIAGGQSLMPMLAMRVARPGNLVDLRRISGLDYIREQAGTIAIGAMTSKTSAEESELIRARQPLFHAATRLIAHPGIRNRGSVGGSFAHADPASEYPALALVLEMQMKVVGPAGERMIPAGEFFVTFMTTSIESNEILTEVRMPVMAPGTGWAIQEVSRRPGDLALAGVALTLRLEGGLCRQVRMAAFGVNPTAVRLGAGEAVLEGQAPTAAAFQHAAEAGAAALAEPMSCIHATSEHRRHMVKALTGRCLAKAVERAG